MNEYLLQFQDDFKDCNKILRDKVLDLELDKFEHLSTMFCDGLMINGAGVGSITDIRRSLDPLISIQSVTDKGNGKYFIKFKDN